MITRVFSAAVVGVDATEVEIEVNTGSGEPSIIVVGLPDAAVKESKDRVIAALSNSGYRWPRKRTTVNLAPADIRKQGPSFDLPIALGMIATDREEELPRLSRCAVAGELALTGEVRPVKGALPLTLEARARGKKAVILPLANVREASVVEGIAVYGVRNLREAHEFLSRNLELDAAELEDLSKSDGAPAVDVDFSEVKGQHRVKRAVEVAVAGGHNLLLLRPICTMRLQQSKNRHDPILPRGNVPAVARRRSHSGGRWNHPSPSRSGRSCSGCTLGNRPRSLLPPAGLPEKVSTCGA